MIWFFEREHPSKMQVRDTECPPEDPSPENPGPEEAEPVRDGHKTNILLKQPVRVPPVPTDEAYTDHGMVFVVFKESGSDRPVHVGHVPGMAMQCVARCTLQMLSSGDGHSIPARVGNVEKSL